MELKKHLGSASLLLRVTFAEVSQSRSVGRQRTAGSVAHSRRYLDMTMCGIKNATPIGDLAVLSPHMEDVVLRENPLESVGPIRSKEVDVREAGMRFVR